jgi:hypothetical protein
MKQVYVNNWRIQNYLCLVQAMTKKKAILRLPQILFYSKPKLHVNQRKNELKWKG